jgi:lipopolysaccharide export system permease protein
MSISRIHHYIIREIAVPTGLGLVIFTFVLLMGRILKLVEMVINKGVPFGEIAKLFLYLMPSFLVITVPLAFLLGVLLGFGRLSTDCEIIALKSSGISLYEMIKPVVGLAIAACLTTGLLTLFAEPAGKSAFRSQVFQIATNRASVGIQPRVFNDDFDGLVLYTDNINERTSAMRGVFVSDERVGATPSIILASEGHIIPNRDTLTLTLRLENGTIHRRPQDKGHDTYQVIRFTTYDINLNMVQQVADPEKRRKKESELTLAELREACQNASSITERNIFRAELHKRFILPLAPLVFALIGVPLGIQSRRSARGGGFSLALAVFLAYYILFSFAETMAVEGNFPPAATLWLPNLLFLTGGLYLLYLTAMEKRFIFLDRILEMALRFTRRSGRKK